MDCFEQLCKHRRSIRKYTDEPVSEEHLQSILRCALMSPSSKRCNPWELFIVRDRKLLQQLVACKTYGSAMLETAPLGIIVALDVEKTDTWQCDGAIIAHNMLLAATDLGLGACWCHVYQREDSETIVHQLIGIPENLKVLCIVTIGHKDEERRDYDIEKLPYEKIHTL